MRAMTWFDHETRSVWSQPWGLAIDGPRAGTRLDLIPANIVPWQVWQSEHPETVVLKLNDHGFGPLREAFRSGYVIGITLADEAKAYPFTNASAAGVINDRIGDFPVMVAVDGRSKAVHTYLRQVGDQVLEFRLEDGGLIDQQSDSTWDLARGIAVDGPLQGAVLQRVPYITAFDWAWEDFYPDTEFYGR